MSQIPLAETLPYAADFVIEVLAAASAAPQGQLTWVEINRLENEADRWYAESIEALFDTVTDPILLMKWKELLDHLEMVTDACEDVANVIESVTVKYS